MKLNLSRLVFRINSVFRYHLVISKLVEKNLIVFVYFVQVMCFCGLSWFAISCVFSRCFRWHFFRTDQLRGGDCGGVKHQLGYFSVIYDLR